VHIDDKNRRNIRNIQKKTQLHVKGLFRPCGGSFIRTSAWAKWHSEKGNDVAVIDWRKMDRLH